MRIFVVNLARRPDRLAEISRDLSNHGILFERVEAIDAKTNSIVNRFRRPVLEVLLGKRAYGEGPIANYLSHRLIWQKMVDENIPSALVLEDDAKISNWDQAFLNLDITDFGLDLLRLGANDEPNHLEASTNILVPKTILGRKLVTGQLWGNVATIITLTAAKKFLRFKKYWFPSDDYARFYKSFGINYAIISPLIWMTSGSTSDVDLVRQQLTISQTLSLRVIKPLRKKLLFPVIELYLRLVSSLS